MGDAVRMDLDAFPRGSGGVIPSSLVNDAGLSASLLTARDTGELTAVRRGVYLESARLERMSGVERHRVRAHAVAQQRPGVVFAGITAAILSGMPVVGRVPEEIVVLSASASGRRRNGVIEIVRPKGDLATTADGMVTTGIVDTLIEVARTQPTLMALTMLDSALHTPRLGGRKPWCAIAQLRERAAGMHPFPGGRRVQALLDRATHLAETPLETLSRVRFDEIGFPAPRLQFSVIRPRDGSRAHLDFAWPEHGVWGEADGSGKYLGSAALHGDPRRAAETVLDEKRREDDVRAATQWKCARWGWQEAWAIGPLRSILIEAGLPIVRRRRK